MELPLQLQAAIERELTLSKGKKLHSAQEELSGRYRGKNNTQTFMSSDAHRLAYLAARMPATYAAVSAVLSEWKNREPDLSIQTMLDIGAGPATALLAVNEHFPSLEIAWLIEQDSDLIEVAKRLHGEDLKPTITWLNQPMQNPIDTPTVDLTIFSYSIGELSEKEQLIALASAWEKTARTLIIVEPGTPAGFSRIRTLRAWLINAGAHLVAPCPNALPCPMSGSDWCHFAARLQRSEEHRQAKGASLGYEDEKYSYVIASKVPVKLPTARILRHPQKRSGHLNLTLCTDGKVINKTISKRDGDLYKQARKLEWGDAIEL